MGCPAVSYDASYVWRGVQCMGDRMVGRDVCLFLLGKWLDVQQGWVGWSQCQGYGVATIAVAPGFHQYTQDEYLLQIGGEVVKK